VKESGERTCEISSAAGSLDGGEKAGQEAGRLADACDVGLRAATLTKSSNCGGELEKGGQYRKSLLRVVQLTHSAGGNCREVDLSADQRGGESHQSELERRHFG
jgi:hypothetical protein